MMTWLTSEFCDGESKRSVAKVNVGAAVVV